MRMASRLLLRPSLAHSTARQLVHDTTAARRRLSQTPRRRRAKQPAEEADFTSVLDHPPQLVRTGRRHGPGLLILGA